MDAKTDYAKGWSDGYAGLFTQLIENRKNDTYCRGFAAGRDKSLSEHRSTCVETFNTPGMIAGEKARRGNFEL